MNLRGGRNAEIKSKLKDIRDYVLLRIWFPFIYQVGKWNSFDENKVILVESNGANLGVSFHPLVDKLYGNKKLKIKNVNIFLDLQGLFLNLLHQNIYFYRMP